MHRDHFRGMFVVALAFASVQLIFCLPVDSAPFGSERTRQNKLVKKDLPIVPSQVAEALDKLPATYLDDLGLGSTSPDKRALLKRLLMRESGRGPFIKPEDDIPDPAENNVLQKRIFYTGRRGSPSFPDSNIPERPGTEMLETREDAESSDPVHELKALLSMRDRARAIHEKINDSIRRYSEAVREQNEPDPLRPRQEWDRILHGFEVD